MPDSQSTANVFGQAFPAVLLWTNKVHNKVYVRQ